MLRMVHIVKKVCVVVVFKIGDQRALSPVKEKRRGAEGGGVRR